MGAGLPLQRISRVWYDNRGWSTGLVEEEERRQGLARSGLSGRVGAAEIWRGLVLARWIYDQSRWEGYYGIRHPFRSAHMRICPPAGGEKSAMVAILSHRSCASCAHGAIEVEP